MSHVDVKENDPGEEWKCHTSPSDRRVELASAVVAIGQHPVQSLRVLRMPAAPLGPVSRAAGLRST